MEIRNIAIIAHVDHGKTTLTDAIMRQTGMFQDESISMDSNTLEKERGITIYSKNASFFYKDTKINIVDTPGHADFGSEVERVLRAVDSVILVVDAKEGPMPQTKFVLKKSLELGIRPIVVINKIDKVGADPIKTHDEVLELFMDLGANEKQLNFPVLYAIGRQGLAKYNLNDDSKDLIPLLDTILKHVTPTIVDTNVPFRFQPFNLAYDNFLGRMAIGRIHEGVMKIPKRVTVKKNNGEVRDGNIVKMFTFSGFDRIDATEAVAGDIVLVAGISDIYIGDTICELSNQEPLPEITIDEPTISLNILVNNSPFAGQDGKFVTNRQIKERLEKELEINVGLKIDFSSPNYFQVFGRGELHIAILLENMRREGYELQVSVPQVVLKEENGILLEPFEELIIDVQESSVGTVIEKISKRKGTMVSMNNFAGDPGKGNYTRLVFEIPTRGLLGYRNQFIMDTRGEGIMYSRVIGFKEHVGDIDKRDLGSMMSLETGKALAYSLWNLQERGALYIGPNTEVYEGMVIGNTSKGQDMAVNPIKGKHLTNMRSSNSDEAIQLTPPIEITLERGLEIMAPDEYLEITPKNIRLRKQILKDVDRVKAARKK